MVEVFDRFLYGADNVEHVGGSSSQANSENGNHSHFHPEESTSELANEFRSECLLTEANGSGFMNMETSEETAKHSQPRCNDLSKNTISESLGLLPEDSSKNIQADQISSPQLCSAEPTVSSGELPEQQQQLDSQSLPNGIGNSLSTGVSNEAVELNPKDIIMSNGGKHLQLPSKDANPLGLPQELASTNPTIQQPDHHCEDMSKDSGLEQHETMPKNLVKDSGPRKGGKTSKQVQKKNLRSLRSSDRVLRSKPQEKSKATESSKKSTATESSKKSTATESSKKSTATESSKKSTATESSKKSTATNKQQKRKKRKREKEKKEEKKEVSDEYLRIRKHLRYLLNRISYERSLIAAYSAEGWKGLSLEKLKPEKELQRAASEILRRKLKIRDLFQRIESLCTEGRLAESLFDSEGEIDSEDIFCALCGSKDIPANNDIILCDGACDRGFHQYCLQPPLLKEDIPPDDEGWLCPGCDCKFDCIELVNESQGTNFSLEDSWEKVFPEAALAAGGQNQDPNYGLPSDDSDDNDYNPDISENDEKDQEDESSSDESDFTSTSDEVEVPAKVDPYLGLPSDDSEDDDYNPDGPDQDNDNVTKSESLSSDFSSDSDDLGAMLVDISSQKGHLSNGSSRKSKSKKPKLGGKKSLNSEVLTTMEPASGEDDATVSEKRSIPRLDYKRLYDETYGNVPSSSSDDEDWNDGTAPRKKKKRNAEVATTSANGNASPTGSVSVSNGLKKNPGEKRAPRRSANGLKQNRGEQHTPKRSANGLKQNPEEDHTPRRCTRKKSNQKGTAKSPAKLPKATPKSPAKLPEPTPTPGSSGKKDGSSTYKRLGEAVTQGLQKSFKQNQYPDRAMKESLAKELGITFRQVSKWFENARWFSNNSNNVSGASSKKVAGNDITPSARRKK
ncbi:homeobox protein HAT3.1 [Gossypium australe]|uniref:Homeobox protein HAT3.1 n=1 Tax=Gossypium australe TaxID=47621 RepID=A0A5B6V313_9ROSI|nr:homeobox protein HAT3.1 [Gossypium australe]